MRKWLSVAVDRSKGEGGGIWLEVSYTYRGEPIGDMHNLVERAIFEGADAEAPAAHLPAVDPTTVDVSVSTLEQEPVGNHLER